MTFLWEMPDEYPEKFIGEYLPEKSPDLFLFLQGNRIPEKIGVPNFKFRVPTARLKVYDVLANSTMIPLISERMANLLLKMAEADVQLFPANIVTTDGALTGYMLVNVLPLVHCIDYGQSDFVYMPGTKRIMKFNSLGVRPNALGGHQLARDAEYTSSFLFVSQALKQSFEMEGFTDCGIVGPETIKP